MFRTSRVLFAVAALSAIPVGAVSARTIYDGRWSVLIMTDRGNCDTGYRYAVNIVNGRILNAGSESFAINGRVWPNGAVRVSVARGGQHAEGSGRLSQDYGSGVWQGVGSAGVCVGRWQTERR
jgi:hypothetical protein